MNVYDFDKTIYDGDSTIDFYLFELKRNPKVLFNFPKQILGFVLYKVKIFSKEKYKSYFYSYFKKIKDIDKEMTLFWKENKFKIKKWYINQHEESDVIVSASAEFFLKKIKAHLNVDIIASEVDKSTGKCLSKNCFAEEKVERFRKKYGAKAIKSFYTDSLSDLPLARIAEEFYLVKKDKIIKQEKRSCL